MTAGSVRGIGIHDTRRKEFSHTNPDIDFSKSGNNYALKKSDISFYNSVQNRIQKLVLKKSVRKDAIVMAQALITSDKSFFDKSSKQEQESFFEKSFKFIENRYGQENIISAIVHLDEKTPHMHVNFVPVTSDQRLCAKDLLNKKEMQALQNDAYKEVFQHFGLMRGEAREEKRRHLDTEEFKIKTKTDYLSQKAIIQAEKIINSANQKANDSLAKIQKDLETTKMICDEKLTDTLKTVDGLDGDINCLRDMKQELEGQIEALESKLSTSAEIIKINGKKQLLGDMVKGITYGEYAKLKSTALKVDEVLEREKRLNTLERDLKDYADRLAKEADKIKRMPLDQQVEWAELHSKVRKYESAFQRLPLNIQEQLFITKNHNSHKNDRDDR